MGAGGCGRRVGMRGTLAVLVGLLASGEAGAADVAWRDVGPAGGLVARDVAVDGRRVLVSDADGAVWRSEDGGRTWSRVMGPVAGAAGAFDRERVRLDAEVRLQELVDDLTADLEASGQLQGGGDGEDALAEALAEEAEAVSQATEAVSDTLQADALQDGFFRQVGQDDRGVGPVPLGWDGDRAWVGRADGLWQVQAEGHAERVAVAEVTALADGVWRGRAVGTTGGLLVQEARRGGWAPVVGGPVGTVHALVSEGDRLWAAADDGVWSLQDGGDGTIARWLDGVAITDVAHDGARAWVTDGTRLWRLDGDEPAFVTPPGTTRILDLDAEDGQVQVLTERAVWTRQQGDDGWQEARLALPAAAVPVAVEVAPEAPWVATRAGLFTHDDARRDDAHASETAFVPSALLLAEALNQPGLRARIRSGRATQVARWLVPQIVAEVRVVDRDGVVSRLDAGRALGLDDDVNLMVRAVWQPPSREVAFVDPEDLVVDVGDGGTEVFSGAFDDGVLVARQSRSAVRDGVARSQRIVELAQQRGRLVASREEASGDDLRARVRLELRIQEIEATLDALTQGAVGRWYTAHAAGGQG